MSARSHVQEEIECRLPLSRARIALRIDAGRLELPVVRLPLRDVRLNPDSLRHAARRRDDTVWQRLSANPDSPDAQGHLAKLVAQAPNPPHHDDPAFGRMQIQLARFGQRHPIVITRDGLIANGNSRVVAMRDIGYAEVDAAVLPDDATPATIQDVELKGQNSRTSARTYPHTSMLMAAESLVRVRQLSMRQSAHRLRVPVATVKMWLRSLARIRAWQTPDGDARDEVPLPWFDKTSRELQDLDLVLRNRASTMVPDELAALEERWMLGIMAGVPLEHLHDLARQFVSTAPVMRPMLSSNSRNHAASGADARAEAIRSRAVVCTVTQAPPSAAVRMAQRNLECIAADFVPADPPPPNKVAHVGAQIRLARSHLDDARQRLDTVVDIAPLDHALLLAAANDLLECAHRLVEWLNGIRWEVQAAAPASRGAS